MTEELSRTSALASRHTALGKSLALAHVSPSASAIGTQLELVGDGIKTSATVVAMPIYDPQKLRTHEA